MELISDCDPAWRYVLQLSTSDFLLQQHHSFSSSPSNHIAAASTIYDADDENELFASFENDDSTYLAYCNYDSCTTTSYSWYEMLIQLSFLEQLRG
jgi:hypothetical protein